MIGIITLANVLLLTPAAKRYAAPQPDWAGRAEHPSDSSDPRREDTATPPKEIALPRVTVAAIREQKMDDPPDLTVAHERLSIAGTVLDRQGERLAAIEVSAAPHGAFTNQVDPAARGQNTMTDSAGGFRFGDFAGRD